MKNKKLEQIIRRKARVYKEARCTVHTYEKSIGKHTRQLRSFINDATTIDVWRLVKFSTDDSGVVLNGVTLEMIENASSGFLKNIIERYKLDIDDLKSVFDTEYLKKVA